MRGETIGVAIFNRGLVSGTSRTRCAVADAIKNCGSFLGQQDAASPLGGLLLMALRFFCGHDGFDHFFDFFVGV